MRVKSGLLAGSLTATSRDQALEKIRSLVEDFTEERHDNFSVRYDARPVYTHVLGQEPTITHYEIDFEVVL